MKRAFLIAALLFAAPTSTWAVQLPAPNALVEAARRGDEMELERLGRRLGAVRLLQTAVAVERPLAERLAALRALPLLDDAWATLPKLSLLLGDENAEVADAGARALRHIVDGLNSERVYLEEIPLDVPQSAARTLFAIAGRPGLRAPLRSAALSVGASLTRSLGPRALDVKVLGPLLGDPEAEVRRAAVEVLDPRANATLLLHALDDLDPTVAGAAGAALCADRPGRGGKRTGPPAAITEPARARIRALVADSAGASLADRLDLIPCLRSFGTPTDRKLLDGLSHSPDASIQKQARAYSLH